MPDLILSLPPLAGAVLAVGLTVLLALVPYALARRYFLARGEVLSNELAGSVLVRISALHALILALVFAQELVNLRDISTAASREAVMVGDIYFDLGRYGQPEITTPIREDIALYAHIVLTEEWPQMAETRRLSGKAWQAWESAYGGILGLEPADPRQEVLRDIMVADIREISGLRRARENAGLTGVHGLFLAAAVLGVVMTAVTLYPHPPSRQTHFLISVFAAYTGLIIFFVLAFAHPYHAPGKVTPVGFEQIHDGQIGEMARRLTAPQG